MSADRPRVLGTAGHVDHGKTALVTALTGKDTDRLPEEKRRGVSIELGYAPLGLPSGRRVSIVDVPGHERFVRTMVAGASGIDFFLMCVAADDGVMPQTREHLTVLRALGVDEGVVAITKVDRQDSGPARSAAAELMPGLDIVDVATPLGTGLDELRAALDRVAARLTDRRPRQEGAVLHVDRCFTLKGVGTVATGTLWSGSISVGDELTVLPDGQAARARSLQVHDEPVSTVTAGQRTAVGLAGPSWRDVKRGDVVCSVPASVSVSHFVNVELLLDERARPLRKGDRVSAHHGTRHSTARVVPFERSEIRPGERGLCQLRLETALVSATGDRLVVRQLAPPDTIAGAVIVDPAARRHGGGKREEPPLASESPLDAPVAERRLPALDDLARQLADLLRSDGERPRADAELAAALGLDSGQTARLLDALRAHGLAVRAGRNLHFHSDVLARLTGRALDVCRRDGRTTVAALRDELGTTRRYAQAVLEHMDSTKLTVRRDDEHVLRARSGDGIEPSQRRAAPP